MNGTITNKNDANIHICYVLIQYKMMVKTLTWIIYPLQQLIVEFYQPLRAE